ncbi:MAG: diacylglycerol O-acyltransferase / trehalose O-mycolyltransferase [Thermoleophilaceae bacterium]|jgi:S-formylglutathione hydrolase FrmB|nr:diacylglycerol O-acyltransferase / trehalose O-mycolyltransferase [Thermoleophilaceae bacterium]
MGRRSAGVLLALACCLILPAAVSASRLETIKTPSRFVDVKTAAFGDVDPHPSALRANVLLPDHYDPKRSYPLLFLVHGAGENHASWAKPLKGNIKETARGLNAIVVMPDGGLGFYTNWWNGGERGGPAWERYHLDELLPMIQKRYRIKQARRYHAIAGFSMGGFGTSEYAELRPDFFGTAVPMSGFVSIQRLTAVIGFPLVTGVDYNQIFGPNGGPYAVGHDPVKLAPNLAHSRLMVYTGNGVPRPGVPASGAAVASGVVEAELLLQNQELFQAARAGGADATFTSHLGVHDWPYWREDLRSAIDRGLFGKVEENPRSWTYRTVAQRGRAWDLSFRLASPPEDMVKFSRSGRTLAVAGSSLSRMAIRTDGGCSLSRQPPFQVRLDPGC